MGAVSKPHSAVGVQEAEFPSQPCAIPSYIYKSKLPWLQRELCQLWCCREGAESAGCPQPPLAPLWRGKFGLTPPFSSALSLTLPLPWCRRDTGAATPQKTHVGLLWLLWRRHESRFVCGNGGGCITHTPPEGSALQMKPLSCPHPSPGGSRFSRSPPWGERGSARHGGCSPASPWLGAARPHAQRRPPAVPRCRRPRPLPPPGWS